MSFLNGFWGISPPSLSRLTSFLNRVPAVLAPFWADGVTGRSGNDADGVVYYNSYTKYSLNHVVDEDTDEMMNRATWIVRQQAGRAYFVASNVVVVTWSNMRRFGGFGDEVSLADKSIDTHLNE